MRTPSEEDADALVPESDTSKPPGGSIILNQRALLSLGAGAIFAVLTLIAAVNYWRPPQDAITSVGVPLSHSLLTADWRLRNSNDSINVPANLPCVAHEALLAAGVLRGDPLYRFNELDWSWVAREDWTFETTFDCADAAHADQFRVLRMTGVDTIALITLNGAEIGSTASAFLTHDLLLPSGLLRPTANTLRVTITSALTYARESAADYPYEVPHTQYYHVWSEPSHRNFVRKPASDFGWDWGGSYIPSGLTGEVTLRALEPSKAELSGIAIRQTHLANGSVALRVLGWLSEPPEPSTAMDASHVSLRLVLCHPACDASNDAPPMHVYHGNGLLLFAPPVDGADLSQMRDDDISPSMIIDSPKLWWPRGTGEANLYELQAAICIEGDDCDDLETARANGAAFAIAPEEASGRLLKKTVGLRTVELVTEKGKPPSAGLPNGTSFYFRVNGMPIFAKGANVIPSHVFPTEEWKSNDRWSWLLQQAAEANMNMVRVWGGGRYQPDEWYEMASRLGLMVWQEMIFACALYPTDKDFLSLVGREVREQVSRLAHHPSIVIWGGNNENEAALNWYQQSRNNRDLYLADYVALYVDTVMPAIRAADYEGRPSVDTSPSNGVISQPDPYVKRWGKTSTKADPSAGSWGDIHYYNYQADCEDPSTYPLARFVSEHGFQSFPAFDTYSKVTASADWSRESHFSEFRMRHPDGNAQMLAMIQRHYRVPPANCTTTTISSCDQKRLFDQYLYLTQLQQARCYETAFTHWRRHRSTNSNTMGILYWQLNSIWQGPDWSTIEYDGRLRLAHHASRRAFAPLLLSALRSGGTDAASHVISIHLSNDKPTRVEGTLLVQLFRWRDAPARPVAQADKAVVMNAAASGEVWTLDLMPLMMQQQPPLAPSATFARLTYTHTGPEPTAIAYHWMVPFKDIDLPIATPKILSVVQPSPTTATIQVASNATAAFVNVECSSVVGAFSDAAFTLLGGAPPTTITFTAQAAFEKGVFVAALRVRSLRDSYR